MAAIHPLLFWPHRPLPQTVTNLGVYLGVIYLECLQKKKKRKKSGLFKECKTVFNTIADISLTSIEVSRGPDTTSKTMTANLTVDPPK